MLKREHGADYNEMKANNAIENFQKYFRTHEKRTKVYTYYDFKYALDKDAAERFSYKLPEYQRHLLVKYGLKSESSQKNIENSGIPTVFFIDYPIEKLPKDSLYNYIRHVCWRWAGTTIFQENSFERFQIHGGPQLEHVCSQYIKTHRHPRRKIRMNSIYCDKCKKMIHGL